jgi:hypothetical protein
VKPQRPKVEPIRQPTLFQMEKVEELAEPAGELKIERPYSLPGILLGTSAFTANGWQGNFYPPGMKSRDFFSYYATYAQRRIMWRNTQKRAQLRIFVPRASHNLQ